MAQETQGLRLMCLGREAHAPREAATFRRYFANDLPGKIDRVRKGFEAFNGRDFVSR